MTRRTRGTRSDSVQTAVSAALDAAMGPIPCPKHVRLRAEDEPFWLGILSSRARDEWTPGDLVVGAQLARVQRDIEVESLALETEGTVIENGRGTPVMNPRATVLEALARREMAFMRTLRMGGAAAGEARHVVERRKASKRAATVQSELEEDALLA
jgi:hypothetical protein